MSYWHRLARDGWICPDCGTRQFWEYECKSYYCQSMRQINDERDRKRHRRNVLLTAVSNEAFLSPAERRRKMEALR